MISILAAVAKNGVIGKNNALPWHIPEDLKRFKALTLGKPVLMGSKTYESIIDKLGKPLPGRQNVVVSTNPDYKVAKEVLLYNSLDKVLEDFKDKELIVIGGGSIYKQTIEEAEKLYITHVERNIEGDAYFPEVDWNKWQLESEEPREGYRFSVYHKK
ncbi:MAG: dihydrofolate reductase [Candidatus Colwellbacteria bacterium]|nr:dihydrofolate reductase [Candidatus Colwellbacteria bacterium]